MVIQLDQISIARVDQFYIVVNIYDTYHIQQAQPSSIPELGSLVSKAIQADILRYGNQHEQLVEAPIEELCFGLKLLRDEPKHEERYNEYVSPMVFADFPVSWCKAMTTFARVAEEVLEYMNEKVKLNT